MRKPELDAPSLQSTEEHLQASMEVWVDNNHMVETYSSMAVYVAMIAFFCFPPHVVDVSALILGSVMLSICSSSCVLYSAGSGV